MRGWVVIFFLILPFYLSANQYNTSNLTIESKVTYNQWDEILKTNAGYTNADTNFKVVYRSIANSVASNKLLSSMNRSLLILFTKNAASKLAGRPHKIISDATDVFYSGIHYIIILSSHLFDGPMTDEEVQFYNEYGFAVRTKKVGDGFLNLNLSWSVSGKSFYARAVSREIGPESIPNLSPSPNYENLTVDGKFSTAILVSNNLERKAPGIAQAYVSFFKDRGFVFDEAVRIDDIRSYLSKLIVNGEIDFLVEEGHGRGNERSFITLNSMQDLRYGKKLNRDGSTDEVYVLFPALESPIYQLSHQDMKEWIDLRSQNLKRELLYLNSSCWSSAQAKKEIVIIDNKYFINIPSYTTTTTFINNPKSVKFWIMFGILNRQDYATIEKNMSKTYSHRMKFNRFLFPSNKEYIRRLAKIKKTLQIMVFDSNNNPISH